MNDGSSTPTEQELVRRLADLADTTTVDEGAWDSIQKRLAPGANPWARRSPWRLAVMAAAAVVLVVGALAMTRDDDGARVDIQEEEDKDKETTTTSKDDDEEVTETTTSHGTSTTIAPGIAGEGAQAGDGGTGTDPGGTDGEDGPRAGGGGPPGSGGGTSIPGTTVPTGEAEMPDGRLPAVSIAAGESALTATLFTHQSNIYMNIWHGSEEWLTDFARADLPGQNCLAGEGSTFAVASGTFDWGIVRADAAEVRIVMTDGSWAAAEIGAEMVPGVRAWLGRRPAGTLLHYEARDGAGNVLHIATPPQADAQPDTC